MRTDVLQVISGVAILAKDLQQTADKIINGIHKLEDAT
jgi:hypothetical protein